MHLKYIASIIFFTALLIFTLSKSAENTSDTVGLNESKLVANQQASMREAAQQFLSLTNPNQKEKLVFSFDSDERTFWNFVPMTGKRKGLSIEEMSDQQRAALHGLLQSTLSTKGYLKTTGIQLLERILGDIEENPAYRNPAYYYLTIFGKPSAKTPWGWRFEGHHLSLNFSSIENEVAISPAFMGSNPSKVPSGSFTGWRVLHEEIDAARALMDALSPGQKEKAIIAETAPREIITGNNREASLASFEGLPYTEMDVTQQGLLKALIHVYAENLKPAIAHKELQRIEEAGYENIYFAWAGSLNEGEGHYYRIHGTTLLIEYDNTQTNANHIHSVWRDLTNDFGRDLLHSHYESSEEGHGH